MMKIVLRIGLVLALFFAAIVGSAYGGLYWWFHHGGQLSNLEQPTLFEVPRGSHARRLAIVLHEQGFLEQPQLLSWSLRVFHRGETIQAGVYELRPNEPLVDLWGRFNRGEQHLFSITFVEGSEFRQWQEQLADHPFVRSGLAAVEPAELMEQLGSEFSHPEGLLFPDTYRFYAGTSDLQLYRQAYQRMQHVVTELWSQRDRAVPLADWYQALILASIVEKETGAEHERDLVASVFVNRLHTGMRLQSDPTIIYGLGERYRGVIYRSDIREHTPYNTYRIDGLPPTPIAMPGRAAIAATLMPATSDYYYFVSRNDGTHVFSRTLEEHNRAVNRYQRNR